MLVERSKILNNYKFNQNTQTKINLYAQNTINQTSLPKYYYKDYSIHFGDRLNRTPEDFYAQKFNLDNMPDTVRKYLFEDFEERHHMPPY